jgi:hypothetical protein
MKDMIGCGKYQKENEKHKKLICWSGRQDSNLRPWRPKRPALPDCATPRLQAAHFTGKAAQSASKDDLA